jgi:hypothetical protein
VASSVRKKSFGDHTGKAGIVSICELFFFFFLEEDSLSRTGTLKLHSCLM